MPELSPAPLPPHPPRGIALIVIAASDGAALSTLLPQLRPEPAVALLLMPLDENALIECMQQLRQPGIAIAHVVAVDGMPMVADRVHVTPPGTIIRVVEGVLRLRPPAEPEATLAESMAEFALSHGERAVCMLLAGAAAGGGADATTISEWSGLLLVEESGAPMTSNETLLEADQVMPVEAMPARCYDYLTPHEGRPQPGLVDGDDLKRIIGLVGQETAVDFSDYKKSTLQRRIHRRMSMNQIVEPGAYVELLCSSPTEAVTLYREMLIGVTRFFRDPEAYAALSQMVVEPLFANPRRKEPVRIWVAGCATGEEAYSIGIIMREAMTAAGVTVPVKIFATDLDRTAVEFASTGIYPARIAEDVSAERLARFFTRKGEGWQIVKSVREMVVFAHHNLVRDPPFFRMDLVTCRNLLIYLQPSLQRSLFSTFHFSLAAQGHLMLGTSETLGDMAQFYSPIVPKWKIYRKKDERPPRFSDALMPDRLHQRQPRPTATSAQPSPAEGLQEVIQQTLFREFMPAFLIVDEHFDLHYTSGTIDRYLLMPSGKPTLNLLKMTGRELSVALGTGVRRALRDGVEVAYDDITTGDDHAQGPKVRLVVKPFLQRNDLRHLAVVIFEERSSDSERVPGQQFDLAIQTDQRIKDLEIELDHTKEGLQTAIEELETANEELQATNEELLASNEELQSTNEELQSVNEELYTVNAEHQAKITELTELNDDILNLLGSTNIGTVFLDQQLCVRKFTRAATAQINLIDKDIGRPLAHISNNIDHPGLVADAQEVLGTQIPKQRRVKTRDGHWHQMRLLPYRTEAGAVKGVIITFIDLSEMDRQPAGQGDGER